MNITMTEWETRGAALATSLAARWPWLHDGALRVKSPLLSAHAELRRSDEGRAAFQVRITVDSSGCITGDALDIANAARMIAEVRDAMLFVYGETAGVVVWVDGECPCGSCSARGRTNHGECERCKGTGKR